MRPIVRVIPRTSGSQKISENATTPNPSASHGFASKIRPPALIDEERPTTRSAWGRVVHLTAGQQPYCVGFVVRISARSGKNRPTVGAEVRLGS